MNEDTGDNVWKNDSIEVYIDGDNSKPGVYEADCSQMTLGRYNIDSPIDEPILNGYKGANGQGIAANTLGIKAAVVNTNYGWATEMAIPLDMFNVEVKDQGVIGFNIQMNDDDDGGDRDHKLSWSEKELAAGELSYSNPSVFGELKFLIDYLSVNPNDSTVTTWGATK
ncbi:hypothetical protein GF312_10925 [Candidatus Poribacteria bacterium]|nr:hypothetical protein [Candidatus Poribacteria bacterium]